jgi:hypothetical protein
MRIFCCIVTSLDRNGQVIKCHHHETVIDSAIRWIETVSLRSIKSGDRIESKTCTIGINC